MRESIGVIPCPYCDRSICINEAGNINHHKPPIFKEFWEGHNGWCMGSGRKARLFPQDNEKGEGK